MGTQQNVSVSRTASPPTCSINKSSTCLVNQKYKVVKATRYGNFGEELAANWHTVVGGEEEAFSFNDSSSFALHNG